MPRTSDDAKERLTDVAMELIWQNRILERKARYFESAIRDAHAQSLIVAPEAKAKSPGAFRLLPRHAHAGRHSKQGRTAVRVQGHHAAG
jgi:hypothetical protein